MNRSVGIAPGFLLDAVPVHAPRILVVEDEAAVRFNLVSYLEDSGYQVQECDDGTRGLELVRAHCPDLVLSDLWMPGINGRELVRTLHQEFPQLPVIVVSGTGVLSDAVAALREGAWDFIAKPIADMAVLEHVVGEALHKARLIRDNQRYQRQLEQANRELRAYLKQLEQDAEAGRAMQQQLLPPATGLLGGYEFSRCLLPSLHLSGDFVDYFAIDRNHLGFYLADVSGHGVSSALVTVLLCSFVRQQCAAWQQENDPTIMDPAALLNRLNGYLRRQRLDKYLTIFYGVIDRHRGMLHYANGGQFPEPILIDAAGARFVPGGNLPLGLLDDVSYRADQLALTDDASLLLCSDGVLELMAERGVEAQKARLLDATAAPLSLDALLQRLGIDRNANRPDDVTLLRVHGAPRPRDSAASGERAASGAVD